MLLNKFNSAEEKIKKEDENYVDDSNVANEEQTLSKIISNKEESVMFGNLLSSGSTEDKELGIRLASNELNEGDISLLEEKRVEYINRTESIKKTEVFFTNENILSLASSNSLFLETLNLVGVDASIEMLKEKLSEIAFTDYDRYKDIERAIFNINSFNETSHKELDEKISNLSKEHKIDNSVFINILAIENQEEREGAFKKELRDKLGWISKGVDFFTKNSEKRASELAKNREEVVLLKNDLEKYLRNIGNILATTVDENSLMRKALGRELTKEKDKTPKNMSFKNSRDSVPTVENTKDEWSKYKKDNGWDDSWGEARKDIFKNEFADQVSKERGSSGVGFWSLIFNALFERSRNDFVNNLK